MRLLPRESRLCSTFFILLTLLPASGFSKDAFDLEARFALAVDDSMIYEDYYNIEANLQFEFEVTERFWCTLELEADRFEVEVDELSFDWAIYPYLYLLFGKFENALTLEEYIPVHKRPFGKKSLVADFIDSQGYISSTIGAELYKKYEKDTIPLAYFFSGVLQPGS